VLAAVREALDEEIAAAALEVALDELCKRAATAEPVAIEAALVDLDAKIERALDLAIELGDLGAAKEKLRGLRAERERVAGELARSRTKLPTTAELLPRLREKLREIEATLKADVPLGRLALGGLLGESRLRVYRDGRIEGLAMLGAEMPRAPSRSLGALSLGGSGGPLHARSVVEMPVRIAA